MVLPKPEVMSSRPLMGAFDTLRSAGVPESAFSPKVLATVSRLKQAEDFVSWDDFLDLLDQGRRFVADDAAFIALFERFKGAEPEMKAFGSPSLSPQAFCLAIFESFGAGSFPGMAAEHRELPDGSVELIFALPEDFRDASSFFLSNLGALRTITARVGLALPKRVDEEISPRRARYLLRFDPPNPGTAPQAPGHHEAFVEVIRRMRSDVQRALQRSQKPRSAEERVAALSARWELTPRQAEVLGCICRGLSNQDISHELGCARKTVELHVTELLRKAGLDSRAQLLSRFAETE